MIKKGDLVNVKINNLAFGGQGVGRIPSDDKELVIFVDDVAPGDVVEVLITHVKRNMLRGYVKRFVSFSPDRIEARCPHFGVETDEEGRICNLFAPEKNCGGCAWQFLDYQKQLEIKSQMVRDALERLGQVENLDDVWRPIIGMDEPWYYRNKLEFSFSHDQEGRRILGFHMKRRHHDLSEIRECHLCEAWVGDFVRVMRKFFEKVAYDGELKTLTVRVGKNTSQVMIILGIENGSQPVFLDNFKSTVEDFFADKNVELKSVMLSHVFNKKGMPKRNVLQKLAGDDFFQEKLQLSGGNELTFNVAPHAFLQPNTKQSEVIYSKVIELACLTGTEKVWDLYCGTGTIGIALAAGAKQVTGIEINASAIQNAKKNAELNGVKNVEFLAADVTEMLEGNTASVDVVVIDPPRAGLSQKACESIIKARPKKVIYVSCNPSSLARDIALLREGGFELKFVQAVDQFCHTYHVETICELI